MKTKDGDNVESVSVNNSSHAASISVEEQQSAITNDSTVATKDEDITNSHTENIKPVENISLSIDDTHPAVVKGTNTTFENIHQRNNTCDDSKLSEVVKSSLDQSAESMKETSFTPDKESGTDGINNSIQEREKLESANSGYISELATTSTLSPDMTSTIHMALADGNNTPEEDSASKLIPQHINFDQEHSKTIKYPIGNADQINKTSDIAIDLTSPKESTTSDEPDYVQESRSNRLTLEDNKDIAQTSVTAEQTYVNKGFVSDEIIPKTTISDVKSNRDPIPTINVSSETNCNTKLPRRVSFSELPPKTMYNNGGFVGDEINNGKHSIGENGKLQIYRDGVPQLETNGKGYGQQIDYIAKYGPGEKWRILRNVVLISAAFMLLFTAFFGAANLQSSVNSKAGLGTVSLTVVYASLIVSNMFLPVMVIRWLGCKWTVAACMLCFAPYAVAQFRAEFSTLLPTALLAGLGGGPMWCAKCTYLNVAADAFAKVTGSAPEVVMVRFFGVFYVLFPLGHVWGNLISSEVLSTGQTANSTNITVDVTMLCGANYCPGVEASKNPNLQRPPDHQIHTIAAIFLACSLLAVLLVAVGVDNLKRYNEGGRTDSGTGLSGVKLLVASLQLLCDRNQLMLIPITAYIGMSQAFLGADFTEGYISCAWGIRHIGYVLLGYGLASSLASVLVSWVVKAAGRLVVICSSVSLFLALVAVLKLWRPDPSQGAVFFVLAALWGLADSTAMVINAMYGLLFRGNEAAAYSNFSLWGSAGFIITYSYSPHLCMNTKLGVMAVMLLLSLAGFVAAERALRRVLRAQQERAQVHPEVCTKPHVS